MPESRLLGHSGKPVIQFRRVSVADALAEQRQLTLRDRRVLALLAEHRVLTADQLTRLVFDNPTSARHRLTRLTDRGVLARFRHYQRPGSQAWRYVLGTLGAMLHAATTGATLPAPSRVAERALSLSASPRLGHLLAVNEFFVSLAHHARTHPGATLAQWWPEPHATRVCGRIARPDGGGEWHEHPPTPPADGRARGPGGGPAAESARRTSAGGEVRRVAFWLELDRGTEPLPRLVDKLTGYRQLADAGLSRPVLIVVPTTTREHHLQTHPDLYSAGPAGDPLVATTSADQLTATGHSPADAVWRLPGDRRRVRLIELGGQL